MKKVIYTALVCLLVSSCSPAVKQIGRVNMISNRNVDPQLNYDIIASYSGGSKKELKKSRAVTIEDAIDQTVKKIPGGDFLMNVKIYIIEGEYFAVEGDVWGVRESMNFRGFKIGDSVTWKAWGNFRQGKIKGLKDDKTCIVETEAGDIITKNYDELTNLD